MNALHLDKAMDMELYKLSVTWLVGCDKVGYWTIFVIPPQQSSLHKASKDSQAMFVFRTMASGGIHHTFHQGQFVNSKLTSEY